MSVGDGTVSALFLLFLLFLLTIFIIFQRTGTWQVQVLEGAVQLQVNSDVVLPMHMTAFWLSPACGSQMASEIKLRAGIPALIKRGNQGHKDTRGP